jgi:hypothetical protein
MFEESQGRERPNVAGASVQFKCQFKSCLVCGGWHRAVKALGQSFDV